jgi:hypothetical protein
MKTKFAPFNVADYLDNDEVIAEYEGINSDSGRPEGGGRRPFAENGRAKDAPSNKSRKGKSAAVHSPAAELGQRASDGGPQIPTVVVALQELQVRRKFCIKIVVSSTNRAAGLVKRMIGIPAHDDEAAQEKVEARARTIIGKAFSGKPQAEADVDILKAVDAEIEAIRLSLEPIQARRDEIESEMERLARLLPAYSFVKGIRGFGDKAFAVLIGEAGDLSKYPKDEKLWSRLGLAPYQGKAFSQWRAKGGLSADEWVGARYNPKRRAEIYACIEVPLGNLQMESAAKSETTFGKPIGPYGEVYVRRREHTAVTHPDWSKGHSRGDALRVMVKAVVSDLWREWNKDLAAREMRDAA